MTLQRRIHEIPREATTGMVEDDGGTKNDFYDVGNDDDPEAKLSANEEKKTGVKEEKAKKKW